MASFYNSVQNLCKSQCKTKCIKCVLKCGKNLLNLKNVNNPHFFTQFSNVFHTCFHKKPPLYIPYLIHNSTDPTTNTTKYN